jgi:ribose 5-phosphate isomerase A
VAPDLDHEKRLAAEGAAALVEDGMSVGLGTGSTARHFIEALAVRTLNLRCVATSPQTENAARALGLRVEPFDGGDALTRLDISVDGADQVAVDGWLVKGGGGAHTREKVVAASSDRFVVIVSSDKPVERIRPPIPLELLAYGTHATLERLGSADLRVATPTPDGGLLADWVGSTDDPAGLAALLEATPGVIEHGLFPPSLVHEILVGRGDAVERMTPR